MNPPKRLLYMPTWREWLAGFDARELRETEYAQAIVSFLRSSKLDALLQEHDAELQFLPHPKSKDLISLLDGTGPRITPLDQDKIEFAEVVQRSDAVITDYSSILWDFLQSHKPALLFQFDLDRYLRLTGMYTSTEFDPIIKRIPTSHTEHELLGDIERLFATDPAQVRAQTEELAATVFPHQDKDNCRRTIDNITRRLPELTVPGTMPSYEQSDTWYRQHLSRTLQLPRT